MKLIHIKESAMSQQQRGSVSGRKKLSASFLLFLHESSRYNKCYSWEQLRDIYVKEFRPVHKESFPPGINRCFATVKRTLKISKGWILHKAHGEFTFRKEVSYLTSIAASWLPPPNVSQPSLRGNGLLHPSATAVSGSEAAPKRGRLAYIPQSVDQHMTLEKQEVDKVLQEIPVNFEGSSGKKAGNSSTLPAGVSSESNRYFCKVCKKHMTSQDDLKAHLAGRDHRVSSILLGIQHNR